MDEDRRGRFDLGGWIVLTTTLIFAFVHGLLFKSMGGETKDFIGGVIVGLVPGYVFSVVVVPLCALIIVGSRTPRFFSALSACQL